MPTVAVCALFHDMEREVPLFRAMMTLQHPAADPAFDLCFSLVEGDSRDGTWDALSAWADADSRVRLDRIDVEPLRNWDERIRAWAALGNATIEQLRGRPWDYLLWCESDLVIPPDLIALLLRNDADIVAPAIFLGGLFYDTWGFRALDGTHFRNEPPYHPGFHPLGVTELASVGSCVLFKRAVFDAGIRFRGEYPDGLLAGVCADARARGFRVFVDSRVAVLHPTGRWERQQYRLAEVLVECGAARSGEDRRPVVVRQVLAGSTPLIGCAVLEPDHPVMADVRRRIEEILPGDAFELATRLRSQADREYTLVVRDRQAARVA